MVAVQRPFSQESVAMNGTMADLEPRPIRWTQEQFYEMYRLGWFTGRRVELIAGEIIEMGPMLGPHATAITKAGDALRLLFGAEYFVRIQMPLQFNNNSEPEPDIAIIAGVPDDYRQNHPTSAALAVEVSDSTLAYDRRRKASLYAQAEIQEYWILNVVDNQLEVHRQPAAMPEQLYGFGYATITILERGSSIVPLTVPNAAVAVTKLLP